MYEESQMRCLACRALAASLPSRPVLLAVAAGSGLNNAFRLALSQRRRICYPRNLTKPAQRSVSHAQISIIPGHLAAHKVAENGAGDVRPDPFKPPLPGDVKPNPLQEQALVRQLNSFRTALNAHNLGGARMILNNLQRRAPTDPRVQQAARDLNAAQTTPPKLGP